MGSSGYALSAARMLLGTCLTMLIRAMTGSSCKYPVMFTKAYRQRITRSNDGEIINSHP